MTPGVTSGLVSLEPGTMWDRWRRSANQEGGLARANGCP